MNLGSQFARAVRKGSLFFVLCGGGTLVINEDMDQMYNQICIKTTFVLFLSAFLLLSGCTSGANTRRVEQEQFGTIPLQYPVVLVHGIVAHDRETAIIDFWGRIPERLGRHGVEVYFGNTDAWGSYESNAAILKTTIEEILEKTNSKKVNIIAHSKGGLDSRYLIWKYDFGDKVASLTTIATPHRGAEIADLIYQQEFIHSDIARRALEVFGTVYGDTNPNLYNVEVQLTTGYMKEFNEKVIMDDRVYFQSIYTTMRHPMDDIVYYYSNQYLQYVAGENDGIVSEYSARWGDNITKIEGISHLEIIDIKKRDISGMDIPAIYINIVQQLAEMGF